MPSIDFKKELNEEQYKAVTATNGQALVLAGAGSGKTRVLVYRVAWLIDQGVSADKILLLTFTNKAANQMMARVQMLLGHTASQARGVWGGTFHSLAHGLLKRYGHYIDVPRDFTIMDEDDRKAMIKNISKGFWENLGIKPAPSPAVIAETLSFSVNSQMSLVEALEQKFIEWQPYAQYFEKIVVEFQQRKKNSHVLDFDDLLFFWYKLTTNEQALKVMQSKWDHILVDEYQDTNTLQAKIIANLAGQNKNILVVGDDAQSIYSFRAANIQNILDFPKNFKHCQIYKLENNYRSTPEIIRVANKIVVNQLPEFSKELKAQRANFVRPELVAVNDNLAEARFIANKIEELLRQGLEAQSVAVLFRASHHVQALEMELNRRALRYEMRGGLKFFEKAHIKDVIAWLKILYNHRDEVATLRVLQMYPGIGPKAAQNIYQTLGQAQDLSQALASNLSLSSQASSGWQKAKSLLDQLLKSENKSLGRLLAIILEHYHDYLLEAYADYRQRQEDLEQLVNFASTYESLDQFLTEVVLQENFSLKNSANKSAPAIVLSTIHQAKGLEWSAVFIINLTTQAFPHPLAVSAVEQEEEKRLFYVAVTRAKDYLYLVYPLMSWARGTEKTLQPSPFLYDIDSQYLNYNKLASSTLGGTQDGLEYVVESDYVKDGDNFLPDVSEW